MFRKCGDTCNCGVMYGMREEQEESQPETACEEIVSIIDISALILYACLVIIYLIIAVRRYLFDIENSGYERGYADAFTNANEIAERNRTIVSMEEKEKEEEKEQQKEQKEQKEQKKDERPQGYIYLKDVTAEVIEAEKEEEEK